MTGIELIAAERRRQIEEEGFTAERDDAYTSAELATLPDWDLRGDGKSGPP